MLLKTLFLAYWKLKKQIIKDSWEDKKEGSKGSWFFSLRTLALYNLFIFSAQEDHAKPAWNLKNNLLLEPVTPKWKLCRAHL